LDSWESNKGLGVASIRDTKSWNEEEVGVEKSTPHNETIFQIGTVVQLDQLELPDQVTLHEYLCGTTNEQQYVKQSTRLKSAPTNLMHYACVVTSLDEPLTLIDALQREDKEWKEVVEISSRCRIQFFAT
jgi:hypothetical protein